MSESTETTALNEDLNLTLSSPIRVAGQTYTSIRLREPLVKDLRGLQGPAAERDGIGATNRVLSQLSDGQVPVEAFENMRTKDMRVIMKWFRPFTLAESDTE